MKTRCAVPLFAAVCAAGSLWADSGTWTATTGGNWNDAANWSGGIIASNSGSTATLNSGTGTIINDMTDPALTLLGIQFAGGGYTLAGNTLTLDNSGFITILGGSHTVSTPVVLSGSAALNVASAQTLVLEGPLSGTGSVTVSGGRVVLGNAANAYTGATILKTGIVEIASLSALGTSSGSATNLVLGDGILRYTGPSATMDRSFTIAPTNIAGARAAIIDVTNATTTLTLAGQVVAPAGCFIKTGAGTLAFTYPGYQELNKNRTAVKEDFALTIDANGSVGTNGYGVFNVDKGRVILGAPGQTNQVVATAWVGTRTLASPRMDIIGGVSKFTGSYFTIGRGCGTAASPSSPSLYINNGSYVEMASFVMANANGSTDYRCNPYLSLDNATLRIFGDCFISENGNATSTVSIANNSLFINDSPSPIRGMILGFGGPAKTDVTFDTASTGRVYQARLAKYTSLTVTGNSVFEMDTTPTNAPIADFNTGKVLFNNGTLAQRTPQLSSDWFIALTNLLVGAGDMTINVASHAWLDPLPRPDPASPGGKLVKNGNGTLVVRPMAMNMQVNAGCVALSTEYAQTPLVTTGTLTFGTGSSLELGAAGGAAGMNLNLAGAPLKLIPHSLSSNPDLWRFTERAMRRADGILQLTPEVGTNGAISNAKGGAFLVSRKTVSGPWTVNYSYTCWATGTDPADGFAFVLHNDPRGLAAIGANGASLGYADTTANKITNSIAVGINVTGHQIRFGRQGTLVDTRALATALPKLGSSPVKTKFTVSYDGSGLLTCMIERPGAPVYRYTWAVNIPAEVGSNEAYLGFTAGTAGRWGQHSITDVLFDNGTVTPPTYCRYGGRIALGSGETLNASAVPSSQQRGFVVGELAYGDQSVVKADCPTAFTTVPAPTLTDKGMWKLNQYANWKPDGRLAVSTNANNSPGSAFTTNMYPISGSWTARFGYDIGLKSSPPADYITFTVQNLTTNNTAHTPNPGFAIMWRYYEGGVTTTSLRMYTNNVPVLATTNIAPVSLRDGGPAIMTVSHDAAAKTVTVITSQAAGAYTNVFTGVDIATAVGGTTAYLGFGAFTGGLNAENIVSDFSFSSETMAASGNGYLAFNKLSGTGTLIKRGTASLALMGDRDQPTSNTVLRLEQGGLVLRKNNLEPLDTTGARSDWIFSPLGMWGEDGTLQVCPNLMNSSGTGTSSRRVRVSDAWTATFSFLFGAKMNPPADAFSFFMHNDPRGPTAVGNVVGDAGFGGVVGVRLANSIGLRWYFYPLNNTTLEDSTAIGRNGVWDEATRQSHVPITLTNGVTDFVVKYNPTAATLTSIMTQGAYVITNTFSGVNIPTDTTGDYAYVGFGGGTGGASGEMRIRNFRLTYDASSDALPNQQVLGSLILPDLSTNTATIDTSVPNSSFKVGTTTVGNDAVFSVNATQQNGTLTLGTVTQSGSATYSAAAGCTLALTDVTGGTTLTKTGSGTLVLKGAIASYTGNTVLSAGTLSLDAATMPVGTDLFYTSGATLSLNFTGKQYVHRLLIDGVQQHGGLYTALNTPWISGSGALVVTFPPTGTAMFVR